MALEKKVTISNKEVTFKADGSLPPRYRMQFQRDYYADILSIAKIMGETNELKDIDFSQLDTTPFYNVLFLMAKTADSSIKDMFEWLSEFDEFPVFEIFMELQDLIMANMMTLVDKVKKK